MKKRFLPLALACLLCAALAVLPAAAASFPSVSALTGSWEKDGYPDYVGGVYTAEDGSTVILLVDDADGGYQAALRAELTDASGVAFGTASYSWNRLQTIQSEITEKYLGKDDFGTIVSCAVKQGYGADGKEFRVVVETDADSTVAFAGLFKDSYGPAVVVEESSAPAAASASASASASAAASASASASASAPAGKANYLWVPFVFAIAAVGAFFMVRWDNKKEREYKEKKRREQQEREAQRQSAPESAPCEKPEEPDKIDKT